MKVSWSDVNHTQSPGSFQILNGVVEIEHRHITIWKSEPTARFTLIPSQLINRGQQYILGTYDVPGEDF
jgi:hypothetical protein